jgi:hypothetical protein
MGIWDKFRSQSVSPALAQRLGGLRSKLIQTGKEHSFAHKLVKEREASSIVTKCNVSRKRNEPAAFVDVACAILTYPAEFGYVVAAEFLNLAPTVGFQAYATILNTLCHLDSLFTPVWTDGDHLLANPELMVVLTSRNERLSRAGRLLAVAMLISNTEVKELRRLYRDLSFDEPIRNSVLNHLRQFDPEITTFVLA